MLWLPNLRNNYETMRTASILLALAMVLGYSKETAASLIAPGENDFTLTVSD